MTASDHDLLVRIDERVGVIAGTLSDHGRRLEKLEGRGGGWFSIFEFLSGVSETWHVIISVLVFLTGVVAYVAAHK